MKKRLGVAVLAAFLVCGAAPASAFTELFAFGDSLSDAGNRHILHMSVPGLPVSPSPPYFPGHDSNGLTWVEDLSLKLGLGVLTPSLAGGNDFAFAGAQTGPTLVNPADPVPIDFLNQVQAYGAAHTTAGP
jgi:phospholipase/lecithinase/hemolysin